MVFTVPYGQAILSFAMNGSGSLLAGTDGSYDAGGAIFRSAENGETWSEVYRGEPSSEIRDIVVNASGHLFAAGPYSEILRSVDNGWYWTPAHAGFPNKFVGALAINSRGELFADGLYSTELYRSTDDGESWAPLNSFFKYIDVSVLALDAQDEMFAGTHG